MWTRARPFRLREVVGIKFERLGVVGHAYGVCVAVVNFRSLKRL